jgi:HSP20 family protein
MNMNVRELIPWGRNGNQTPTTYGEGGSNPFLALHREVNRLFDDVFRDFGDFGRFPSLTSSLTSGWPSVEVTETDKQVKVTAEIPGLEEKDVEVLLQDNVLTLKGEKRSEVDDKDRQFSERYYGRFERRIPVGPDIETDKVEASFKNGILTVTLPKTTTAQSNVKRIAIKS